eukprot:CAMPEP_0206475316 /NCGR_PEP_ID=MMETSP0324_2-20121206/34002_1 /ASSEMBLY_ACC=CAM_ASM_000836 /TAXON_ID=2866 /ORGANISM="Crypthecodinium cohnii, Strain Seligo" /LENGTH=50 /DNA_ID=CAMNT_0053950641 /DNA_START=24 /DNA_END=176 /DNA_ORIENTATION=-
MRAGGSPFEGGIVLGPSRPSDARRSKQAAGTKEEDEEEEEENGSRNLGSF